MINQTKREIMKTLLDTKKQAYHLALEDYAKKDKSKKYYKRTGNVMLKALDDFESEFNTCYEKIKLAI
jgi:hypothetical protein